MGAGRQLRTRKTMAEVGPWRMDQQEHRHERQAAEHHDQLEPLEAPEVAGAYRGHDHSRGRSESPGLGYAKNAQAEANADELRDQREGIEHEKIDDAEGAPESTEPAQDKFRMTDLGDGAQPQHHLLIHVQDGDQ